MCIGLINEEYALNSSTGFSVAFRILYKKSQEDEEKMAIIPFLLAGVSLRTVQTFFVFR